MSYDREPAEPSRRSGPQHDESVLNDKPDLGVVGTARSSGGASSAHFMKKGMAVIAADGTTIGIVDSVSQGMILLTPDDEGEGPSRIPLELVDGVDDSRVILADRGDSSFGLGAQP